MPYESGEAIPDNMTGMLQIRYTIEVIQDFMQSRVYSLIGLATKAGRVKSGGFLTEQAVRAGHARLVIVTQDASANTTKAVGNACTNKGTPIQVYGTKDELGACMGKASRSCAAITDSGFAAAVLKAIEQEGKS